ncbi:MAG: hypothetical protein A2946_01770 [Candidatus Liptonbacteria bacterium RIFCSPLOWO2_01_FULL_53_13]|uniref:GIY-YIG domain-containing protein n=1 Tax=Candidatus Liptonbacteria bacterium RIFCSPLOWO2_01_FULL_53_13 TaxID=1798651 RepID=A0A1G2CG07_9BACT|nr:MAG: hypothetical protein A2946_01770 [Candidatus Liptonbacteria bacterium RIFCSPLOWO2_01_FULL_53_13]
MYFVYILQSKKTGKYYTEFSNDPMRRLVEHNAGRTKSLRNQIPLEIIKIEEYAFYEEARARERQIKRFKSGEAFKKLVCG